MDAELVLDAACVDVVERAERAVGIDEEFRNQKQRNAPRAGRRIGQAGQHEMHDVIGHVVVAIGDEDFCALDAIGAVICAFGAAAQRADVGAGLRLGELHGAGPFARHQLFEIDFFQLVLPCASSASIAESVSSGQRPKAMLDALQISVQAALIAIGKPCPPNSSEPDTAFQPAAIQR